MSEISFYKENVTHQSSRLLPNYKLHLQLGYLKWHTTMFWEEILSHIPPPKHLL
jgi:hypothetical protein